MVAARGPAQDLVLFQMDVDGVLRVVARINDAPVFRAVLLDGEADRIAVHESVVDYPLAVAPIEDEVARDQRRHDARKCIEAGPGGRINAAIRDRGANSEFHTKLAVFVARSQYGAGWPFAVLLFKAVLQPNGAVAA